MQNTLGNLPPQTYPINQDIQDITIAIKSFFIHSERSHATINTSNSIHKNHNWLGLVQRTYLKIISFKEYENNTDEIGITQIIATKIYGTNNLFPLLKINGKKFFGTYVFIS